MASVSARWVDLGTCLVLRHAVRVVGADEAERAGKNGGGGDGDGDGGGDGGGGGGRNDSNQENHEDNNKRLHKDGEGTKRKRRRSGGGGGMGEKGPAEGDNDGDGGDKGGAATTVEVDLSEVRWAEVTGGEDQRQSEAQQAKKNLAGARVRLLFGVRYACYRNIWYIVHVISVVFCFFKRWSSKSYLA